MFVLLIVLHILACPLVAIATYNNTTFNHIDVTLHDLGNSTLLLVYNLTCNASYFVTLRLFGDEPLRFGPYSPTHGWRQASLEILHSYRTRESFYLFISCFHSLVPFHDLDIQCRDIRLAKKQSGKSNSSDDFLPSYNPLFVPMMYGLSVLMLLPVIIQHHRHKQALLKKRHKELRRLSIGIAQDNHHPQQTFAQRVIARITPNGTVRYDQMPAKLELHSAPSMNTMLEDLDEHTPVTFTLDHLHPWIRQFSVKSNEPHAEANVSADDCIAHLLDNTPWNTPQMIDQPLMISRSSPQTVVRDQAIVSNEPHVSITLPFTDDELNDRRPILPTEKQSRTASYRTRRAFFESDV